MPRPFAASRSHDHCVKPIRGLAAGRSAIQFFHDPVSAMCEAYRTRGPLSVFGNVLPFQRHERLHVLALGPEFNRQVLGNPNLFHTSGLGVRSPRDSAHRRVSFGLTTMNGETHEQERRLLMSVFDKKAVESYCPRIVALSDQFLTDWPVGQAVDMWPQMQKLTLRIAGSLLLGQHDPRRAEATGQMVHEWIARNWSMGMAFRLNLPGTPYRRMLKHAEELERHILKVIEEKRSASLHEPDMLFHLIRTHDESSGQLPSANLVGQTTVLFAASFETSVNALTWTLYLLAQHPSIMADLLNELDGRLHGDPPTSEQLGQLPLLEAVIKESMRILPPVPYTSRRVKGTAELGPVQLQKGDRVILSHYITHHMPELYAEPEKFHPQRWFEIKPSPYEYLPFSAGPRMCIGYGFAISMIKISLAMILQRFRLTVVPGARIDRFVQVSMRPKHGLPMVIHRQDRRFQAVPVRGNIHEMVKLN